MYGSGEDLWAINTVHLFPTHPSVSLFLTTLPCREEMLEAGMHDAIGPPTDISIELCVFVYLCSDYSFSQEFNVKIFDDKLTF